MDLLTPYLCCVNHGYRAKVLKKKLQNLKPFLAIIRPTTDKLKTISGESVTHFMLGACVDIRVSVFALCLDYLYSEHMYGFLCRRKRKLRSDIMFVCACMCMQALTVPTCGPMAQRMSSGIDSRFCEGACALC